jgi:signal peptidase I
MLDWLANISVKWAVVIVGLLVVVRMSAPRVTWLPKGFRQFLVDYAETFAIAAAFVFLVLHRFVFQLFFIPSESMVPTLLVNDRIVVNRFIYRFRPPERGEVIVFHAPPQASLQPKDFVKRVIGLPNETIEIVPDRLVIDGRPVARLVSQQENVDTQQDLSVPPGAELAVVENQLLVNGRPFVVLSSTGGASPRADGLYVDGRPVQTFGAGDLLQPQSLPAALRHAGLQGSLFSDAAGNALYVVRGRRLALDPGHVLINGKSLGGEPYVREPPRYAKGPIKLGPNEYFMMGDNRNNSADSHAWGPLDGNRIVGKATLMFWPPTRAGVVRGSELYAHAGK